MDGIGQRYMANWDSNNESEIMIYFSECNLLSLFFSPPDKPRKPTKRTHTPTHVKDPTAPGWVGEVVEVTSLD